MANSKGASLFLILEADRSRSPETEQNSLDATDSLSARPHSSVEVRFPATWGQASTLARHCKH